MSLLKRFFRNLYALGAIALLLSLVSSALAVTPFPYGVSCDAVYDTNGNEILKFSGTSSATNEVTLANAATGSGPTISTTGSSDSNVDMNLTAKGSGVIRLNDAVGITGNVITTGTLTVTSTLGVTGTTTLGTANVTTLNATTGDIDTFSINGGTALTGMRLSAADTFASGNTTLTTTMTGVTSSYVPFVTILNTPSTAAYVVKCVAGTGSVTTTISASSTTTPMQIRILAVKP